MKHVLKPLAAALAMGSLIVLAACDQNSDEQASTETGEETVAELPEGSLPESTMPESDMPESALPEGGVAAGESADEAATGCQAAADALGGVWVGRPFAEAEGDINAGEGVATIRIIRPGTAVTKDFRPDRLNVDVNEEEIVTRIYCG
ncbi:MAG: hypothetical protein KF895_15175 [Parvibaculum sp.]|nr:hypothetical protein [Parvibaculum sp.]